VVIREGFSEKKTVQRAFDSFDRAALLGIVVNSCSSNEHSDYYSPLRSAKVRTGEVPLRRERLRSKSELRDQS